MEGVILKNETLASNFKIQGQNKILILSSNSINLVFERGKFSTLDGTQNSTEAHQDFFPCDLIDKI